MTGKVRRLFRAPTTPDEPSSSSAARLPGGPFDVPAAALAGVVAMLLTVPVLRLWRADLDVPFAYSGDANSHGMLIKAVLDHGWYERNPNLGAPFGQRFNDFPMPDNLHLVAAKALGVVSDSYGAVMNLYYLLGFGLAAGFAALVLRALGVSRGVSLVVSLLYAFAPYHFIRGESQLFLASYYAVPLGVLLAVGVLGHLELFPRRRGVEGWAAFVTWPAAATLGMCVLVGSSSAYYGAFAVILVVVAVVGQGVAGRDRHAVVTGLVVAAAICATVAGNVAPDVLWSRSHGSNREAVYRAPGDTETYSLKLTQLLLPSRHHRIDALGDVTHAYLRDFPLPSEPHPLGAVAAFGVVYLVGAAAVSLLRRPGVEAVGIDRTMIRHLGVLTVAALLVAMTGGLASLFELVFIPILRGWNRIAIFVAFLGLLAVALTLDQLRRRWMARRPLLFSAVLLVVGFVGMFDQTSPEFVPDYASNRASFQSDGDFVHRIEAVLPADSLVLQLPFVAFPEAGPLHEMIDYDHFRGYLHSSALRWSYGGIKGRPEADWPESLAGEHPEDALPRLAAVGFAGIYIDRAGYLDHGQATEAAYTAALGAQPMVSRNGRLSFFDLREFRRSFLASESEDTLEVLRLDALTPVRVGWGDGFYEVERLGETSWRWSGSVSRVELEHTGRSARTVEISLEAATGSQGSSSLTLTLPGASAEVLAVSSVPVAVVRRFELPPGRTEIEFRVDAPAVQAPGELRDLRLRVIDFRLATVAES